MGIQISNVLKHVVFDGCADLHRIPNASTTPPSKNNYAIVAQGETPRVSTMAFVYVILKKNDIINYCGRNK